MTENIVEEIIIQDLPLWDRMKENKRLLSVSLEVTARCNNNCRHCYINLPAKDREAKSQELTIEEISRIADEAIELGAVWILITGGEPLLREDFSDIYIVLKRKGLLVTVFTNATLIKEKHVDLFKKYPPRNIEVSVYGASRETYEKVTRISGSFSTFSRGLSLLVDNGVAVRLKAMALKSTYHEMQEIGEFCRQYTKDYYRFDPLLHLRFDRDESKNAGILSERLSPEEIVMVERSDQERFDSLNKGCDKLINEGFCNYDCDHLFHCGAGNGSISISYDGKMSLCSSLWDPDTLFDLRSWKLKEAWNEYIPKVRDMRSKNPEFLQKCRKCPIINLCLWCPAHAYLEKGAMDAYVEYFCRVAHARAAALGYTGKPISGIEELIQKE